MDKTKRLQPNFTSLSNLPHRRDQRQQLPMSHKSRQKTVSRSWQPGIRCFLKMCTQCKVRQECIWESDVNVLERWNPHQVALWDYICTLIYPVEIALGLLEASSKKSSRKIMWNLVQAVFIYIVCNDNDRNANGMRKTLLFEGTFQVIHSYRHWMQECMLQCPWLAPQNDGNLSGSGPRLWLGRFSGF